MGKEPLLSVRGLKTHFFADEGVTRAVDGVSFDVYEGKILGVVGETGCGKSVTARSILRIVDKPGRIVAGEIRLREKDEWVDLAQLPVHGERLRAIRGGEIGLIFQEPMTSFGPVHTVGNQIMEAVRLHLPPPERGDKKAIKARAVELLEMVGVPFPEERLGAYPWQLSGGTLQRCMIAMALAGRPRLLIADEPTTAIDVITQAQILDLIRDLQQRTGLAIMLITHDLGVIAEMADDVVVMYLGRVAEKGPVQEIFRAPRHPYTKALLESVPSAHKVARVKLPTIKGIIPHPFNRPAGCPFHARCDHVVPGLCDTEEPLIRTVIDGHEVSCHVDDLASPAGMPAEPGAATAAGGNGAPGGNGQGRQPAAAVSGTAAPAAPVVVSPNGDSEVMLLEVRHLDKKFSMRGGRFGKSAGDIQAVDDVSFEVPAGKTLALVGESGSGKTTASRCILRAHAPENGEILFRTRSGDVLDLARLSKRQLRPLRSELQMIFQDPYSSLNPRMTVLDIVGEPLLVNGVKSRSERTDRVEELLGLVGLRKEYMHRFPHAFSGGQRQRIGVARALALNPRMIVADEPVSALDVSVQAQTLNLLMDIQDKLQLTYLFVSHDLSVVKHISDRIGVMYAGQLVELGDCHSVLSEPKHPYTAALLAAIPRTDPGTRTLSSGVRPRSPEPSKGCRFQPRCKYAIDRCAVEEPSYEEIAPGRYVRCHRAPDLVLPTPDSAVPVP